MTTAKAIAEALKPHFKERDDRIAELEFFNENQTAALEVSRVAYIAIKKELAKLKDQQRDFVRVCHWSEDEDGIWNTTCKLAWSFEYATTPKENGMNYCPKCGATLLQEI